MAIVAVAGPLSNLALAGVLAPLWRFTGGVLPPDIRQAIFYMIVINLLLFAFNLIPIPPLDGFNILVGILPNYWSMVLSPIYRYSLPILLGFVFFVPYLGGIIGIDLNPLSAAIGPVRDVLFRIFLGIGV
jgi:Zn-dependent protease